MIASLEDDRYTIYNEDGLLIGGIKAQSNFSEAVITVGEKEFKLLRDKWTTKVLEKDKTVYNLKTNSFSGNTKILETGQKITGVFGFKWGTKLVDNENNTLLKIRNDNQFINNHKYVIEVANDKVTDFDILLTLYGHLHGSNMKQKAAMLVAVSMGVITSVLTH